MFPIAVSVNVVVACSVVVFIAGVLGGLSVGICIGYCWGKTHSRKPHLPPPEAPLYEDIVVIAKHLEMKENVAYEQIRK